MNSKFRSFRLPTLLIRLRPLTLVPDCLIVGVIPVKQHSCLALSKLVNPSVSTIRNIAVFFPIPGMLVNCSSCFSWVFLTKDSSLVSIWANSFSNCFSERFRDRVTIFEGVPRAFSPWILFLTAVRCFK